MDESAYEQTEQIAGRINQILEVSRRHCCAGFVALDMDAKRKTVQAMTELLKAAKTPIEKRLAAFAEVGFLTALRIEYAFTLSCYKTDDEKGDVDE